MTTEKHRIDTYGKDSAEWLARWDSGKTVWTIEMGGLGPGYEQCIHITCAEILRECLDKKYDAEKVVSGDKDYAKFVDKHIDVFSNDVIKKLGLSGAQWGAAKSLAWMIYSRGPIAVMEDPRVKDRHVQVSKNFPS